jgi:hypothetical protein
MDRHLIRMNGYMGDSIPNDLWANIVTCATQIYRIHPHICIMDGWMLAVTWMKLTAVWVSTSLHGSENRARNESQITIFGSMAGSLTGVSVYCAYQRVVSNILYATGILNG